MNEFVDSGNPLFLLSFSPGIMLVFVQKITFILIGKSTKTVATRAALFWLKYAPNRLSAGASPQTPLGKLTALPQTP